MNADMARNTISELRKMTVAEADARLCRMRSECWTAIAAELGVRLPTIGGDKPAIIIGQLKLKAH